MPTGYALRKSLDGLPKSDEIPFPFPGKYDIVVTNQQEGKNPIAADGESFEAGFFL